MSISNLTQSQLMRLSQGQLNLLERCPRQFQHTYLEQLRPPTKPENEEKQLQGSRFHLLMQQREMGLKIGKFLQTDDDDRKNNENILQLQNWMRAFAIAAPEILTQDANSETFRESEHYRTLQVQDYLLTAIYDLLIADKQQAQIFDWKTYPKPQNKRHLQYNWQTRLYLYVLAETSNYPPENISMTYWFVQSDKPHSIEFTYSSSQHQQTKKKLNQHLDRLTQWLEAYQQGEQFPQLPVGNKTCNHCQYASRCQRLFVGSEQKSQDLPGVDATLVNLANIQEVPMS